MKIKLIACEVLLREFCRAISESPHAVSVEFCPIGLHQTPEKLHEALQKAIDETDSSYDAICLGYGLCSRGTAGLAAGEIQLVIPRAHDCITLLMGSKEIYQKEFFANPGTYYYSSGWVERSEGTMDQSGILSAKDLDREKRFQEYLEKYGEDNARYLIETEENWLKHYSRACFINLGIGQTETYREFTQRIAQEHGWEYSEIAGDGRLFKQLLEGDWNSEDFLIVPPHHEIIDTNDTKIVEARKLRKGCGQ